MIGKYFTLILGDKRAVLRGKKDSHGIIHATPVLQLLYKSLLISKELSKKQKVNSVATNDSFIYI